jgi:uncharacterized protein
VLEAFEDVAVAGVGDDRVVPGAAACQVGRVPSPVGPLHSLDQGKAYYEMLFPSIRGESVKPIMRLYGEDFVVDETLFTGEIIDGHWCLCDGKSGPVRFRLLHVFEFAGDGKFKSERVWFDLAAIQQQLGPAERPEVAAAGR